MASRRTFPLQRPSHNAWSSDDANRGGHPTVVAQVSTPPQVSPPKATVPSLAQKALAARATIGGSPWFSPQSQHPAHNASSPSPLVRRAAAPQFSSNVRQPQQGQNSSAMHAGNPSPRGASLSSSATAPVHRSNSLVQSPHNRSLHGSNTEIRAIQRITSPQFGVSSTPTQRRQLGACSPRVAASSPALTPRRNNAGSHSGQLASRARAMTPPFSSAASYTAGANVSLPIQRLQPASQQAHIQTARQHGQEDVGKIDGSQRQNELHFSVRLRAQFPPAEARSMSQTLAAKLASPSRINTETFVSEAARSPSVRLESPSPFESQLARSQEHSGDQNQVESNLENQAESHSPRSRAMSSSSCDRDALGISAVGPFADMDSRLLSLFTSSSQQHLAEKGDIFFAEGDSDDRLFIMVQGEVEMMTSVLPGHKPFTRILRAPCYFGEACAIGLQQIRSSTVRAQTFCEVRVLLGETFRELLHRFPHEEKLIINEAKSRLAGLAIWEGVSRKRSEEHQFRPTSGSTTSWSQESSVAVSRRGSFSNRSGFKKTSSLGSQASSMPSGSQPSSVPLSRTGSKSPPRAVQEGAGINGKQSSSGSTNPSSSTDPKSSGSSNGLDMQQIAASKSAAEIASSSDSKRGAEGVETCREISMKPWMVALAEVTSPRDTLHHYKSQSIVSEVPCEFAWSDGSVQDEMMEIVEPPESRHRGRSREDREMQQNKPGISRQDTPQSSVSSQSSPGFEPASSMSRLPGTSSLRVLPAVGSHTKGTALDAHLEDHFEEEMGPKNSSSSGHSPTLSSISSPQELTPVNGQSSRKWHQHQRNQHHRKHKPPKPREGWQQSLCQQVIINYPAALPSKDTFVKRKVPRPVSREASCGSIIEGLEAAVEKVEAESSTSLSAGLPEAAASRLRESSPEIELADEEMVRLAS